ncbi:secreted protein [Polyplosphaeria fusca]|uniref:Secreted protein n=1 Tax=Polyplosphaeria fusca TaxID=682080 RepID=A0A9P4QTP2_9PLEO|nr:secreted protein [Polyplosphaeria fusca]
MRFQHISHLAIAIGLVDALPNYPTDPSFDATVDRGTFENPSPHVRPKFRYWIPDASVDTRVVARDVEAAKAVGAGGLELLGYYLYGGPPSNGAGRGTYAPVDWAKYGFGTDAWHAVFKAFVQAHKDNGLVVDFAMGPNQGTGVPAPADDEGLMWDLAAYNVTFPIGGTFDAQLPGWGTGALQAAVWGTVLGSQKLTTSDLSGGLPGDLPLNRMQYTLSSSSLTDVTSLVNASGHLHLNMTQSNASNITGDSHIIFAIYLIQSYYRAQQGPLEMKGPQNTPETYIQNGSWAVDHFSALGARVMTKFWEEHILDSDIRGLLQEVGNYGWEDSVEIEANVYWTKNFTSIFEDQHKYSINKWLPILFHRNGHYKQGNPGIWWVTDEPSQGNTHIADYRATLASQYRVYEQAVNKWAEDYLHLQFSAQLSYNLPMDMLANIPSVGAPETESLDFSDLIDGYRQYSGPANLARRRIISSECGAVRGEAYAQTLPELLWKVKRSYAGSINQFVFHGFPYSGTYGNTTWPTWTTFNYQYSTMHGPHEPAWEFYRDQLNFIARNNWVFQSGIPRLDIAIWQKMTTYPGHIQLRTYEPTDLEKAGYSYEYLSPDNFDLPAAKVVDGILAPNAQAFKVLVVRANDSLTLDGVSKLIEFANAGLPIVLAGGVPSSVLGTLAPNILRQVLRDLHTMSQLPNVHITSSYFVGSTIASLGIQPLTRISTNASWYTYWRSDMSSSIDYVFIYNDAMRSAQGSGASEGHIEFQSIKIPHEFNAWTGERRPIVSYTTTNTSTTISFKLAGNQSAIIAFVPPTINTQALTTHLTAFSGDILGSTIDGNRTVLQISTTNTLTLSNGSTKTIPALTSPPFTLSNWTLIVEHWDPPTDLYNYTSGAVKLNTTHHLPSLIPWLDIPSLQNVSGRGYYSTHFTWPPSNLPSNTTTLAGAFIDFGAVYHTLVAYVNGHRLPPLDVTHARADIKGYLKEGENAVEAVVATPLGNVLRPIWHLLQSSGEGPASADAGSSHGFVAPPQGRYGLVGDVRIVPYAEVEI